MEREEKSRRKENQRYIWLIKDGSVPKNIIMVGVVLALGTIRAAESAKGVFDRIRDRVTKVDRIDLP